LVTTTRETPDAVAAIALLEEPTRRRLYQYVAKHSTVGRDAAAQGIGISRELAAFHLDKLVDGGLLETSYRRLTGRTGPGAGRPAKLYSRSSREVSVSLPQRKYEVPADVFASGLELLATSVGNETVTGAVNEPAHQRGLEEGAAVRKAAGPRAATQRQRAALVEQLAADGFEPSVDPETETLTLGSCPYQLMAESHRDLTCGMNLAWARGIVEAAVGTGYEPKLDYEPGRCCVVFEANESR
jgi:predicted ArsR family transcriptional regulator